ncbi:tetratricopeptide repeat protein [Flavobacterium hauense]
MMIPNSKNCLWKFSHTTIWLTFLFAYFSVSAQQKGCGYQNFWFKADYKNLRHAETEKNRYAKILATKGLHDTIYAKAQDITGIYYDFTGNPDKAISCYKKAITLLNKYPEKKIAAMVNIAIENNILGKFDTALKWSKEALKINKKKGNAIYNAQIYHTMAASYLYKGDIEKATAYVLKGIKILEERNDNCYIWQLKITLAGTYLQSNNYRFAADLLEEYLTKNKAEKDTKVYFIATVNYTENLIELNQTDKAYTLLSEIIPNVKKAGDKELEAVIYAKIANIENLRGNTQKSLAHYAIAYNMLSEKKSKYTMLIFSNYIAVLNETKKYNEAIKLINEFRNTPAYRKSHTHERYEYERAIAGIYTGTGNWKESSKAFETAMLMCDTLRMHENGRNLNAMQAKFQTDFQREKNTMLANNNQSLKKKVEAEKQLSFMYIIGSLGIIALILVMLRGYWLKARLQKEAFKSVEKEKNYLEQQHALEQELSNSQKQMIDEKQRDATSMALQMANYYDALHSVIEKLDSDNLKLADVKKELIQLTQQKNYWKEFDIRFKNANPEFENKLTEKYPMLTRNDIQFCSLLKLNLSYKEIASLLQISYESTVTKKYRIKKKMGIAEDEDFEKLLISI